MDQAVDAGGELFRPRRAEMVYITSVIAWIIVVAVHIGIVKMEKGIRFFDVGHFLMNVERGLPYERTIEGIVWGIFIARAYREIYDDPMHAFFSQRIRHRGDGFDVLYCRDVADSPGLRRDTERQWISPAAARGPDKSEVKRVPYIRRSKRPHEGFKITRNALPPEIMGGIVSISIALTDAALPGEIAVPISKPTDIETWTDYF